MIKRAQRGSRVIYVAASARELGQDVQDWLSQTSVRAAASPDPYDCLAQLVKGKTPLALIVSIASVDWTEIDFFRHVQRLRPETVVFVTGAAHHADKIEAALARGARLFDAEALNELLAVTPPAATRTAGPAGLLAGSLRTEVEGGEAAPRLVPPEPVEPEPSADQESLPPPVRLVNVVESEDADTSVAVPYPWAPAANRPRRVPPVAGRAPEAKPDARRRAPVAKQPVKLTPEELAALMEQPLPENGRAQEGGA